MIVETATVWAFSALFLVMLYIAAQFLIFFVFWYVFFWGIAKFYRQLFNVLSV